jgi:immunity protein 74 of polymorphic toxin system
MPERFSEPKVNLIESDAGFSVEVLGRTGLRYTERGRTVYVDSEVMATPGAMLAYRNSMKRWSPPHESDALDDSDRDRIMGNIRRAFESQGYTLQAI